jgi:formamidopyrimidine-DNA glycosylase
MPELPETETIARDLDATLRGATVLDLHAAHPDVLRGGSSTEQAARLRGASIVRVWRRAKLVVVELSHGADGIDAVVAVQPRFTGALLLDASSEADPYICVVWTLADGRTLAYRDVRRLGTVTLFSWSDWQAYSAALGREPLDPTFAASDLSASIRTSSRAIKAVLMDQRILAGVGNIYATEALWAAGIDPSRSARSLSDAEGSALLEALREILPRAIAARGTSFRDYRDAHGGRGRFVEQLTTYGRAGEPCRQCAARLIGTNAIDGRMTVFCARCQR